MGQTKAQKIVKQLAGNVQKQTAIATDMFIPNHSGDNSAGDILKTPTKDNDIPNKKYVDDEDAALLAKIFWKRTGTLLEPITSGDNITTTGTIDTGILYADKANSVKIGWDINNGFLNFEPVANYDVQQAVVGGAIIQDWTNDDSGNLQSTITGDNTVTGTVTWSGGSSTATNTHIADNTQAHSDYLINNGNDTTSGTLTADTLKTYYAHDDYLEINSREGGNDFNFIGGLYLNEKGNSSANMFFNSYAGRDGSFIFQENSVNRWLFGHDYSDSNGFRIYNYALTRPEMTFDSAGGINLPNDNEELRFGVGDDLKLSSDGTRGVISTTDDLDIDCGTNKTIELQETVYKDINIGGYLLTKPSSGAPDVVNFVDEAGTDTLIPTYAFDIGEKVSGGFELQHDYAEGTDFVFHVHFQGIAAPTGTDNVQWRLTYILMRDGETLNAAVTIDSPDTTFDTQYETARTDFTAITGTNFLIGDQFMFTLERVTATGDAYAGDALIGTTGIHYEVDTLGSRQITVK